MCLLAPVPLPLTRWCCTYFSSPFLFAPYLSTALVHHPSSRCSEAINAAKLPPHYSLDFRNMVAKLLDKEPQRRPSVSECVAILSRCLGAPAVREAVPRQGQVMQKPQQQQQQQQQPLAPRPNAGNGVSDGGRIRKRDEAMQGVHAAVEVSNYVLASSCWHVHCVQIEQYIRQRRCKGTREREMRGVPV